MGPWTHVHKATTSQQDWLALDNFSPDCSFPGSLCTPGVSIPGIAFDLSVDPFESVTSPYSLLIFNTDCYTFILIIIFSVFLISWLIFSWDSEKHIQFPTVPKKCLNGNTNCKRFIPWKSPDPDSFGVLIESSRNQTFSSINALQLETSRKSAVVNPVVFISCCSKEKYIPQGTMGCLVRRRSERTCYRIWALVGAWGRV